MLLMALSLLVAIAASSISAPVIGRYSPDTQDLAHILAPPSSAHWFGTDELGRDLFSRLLRGGQLSLLIAAGASLVATTVGVAWGFTAAIRRGKSDDLLMRTADVVMATPQMLLALICAASFGSSEIGLILIIGIILAPITARLMRAVALTETARDYYPAAIAYGAGLRRLLFRELLPNTRRALALQLSVNAAGAIILEASLSFLGLGIQPPRASWGTLLQQGYGSLYQSVYYVSFPAGVILITVWMLNLVADQLGDENSE